MLTIFSAYGGTFNPEKFVIASVTAMLLPLMLMAGAMMIILNLLFDRRLSLIILTGWSVSLPSIMTFSPINIETGSITESEKERAFSLLTYNVLHFWDFRGHNPDLDNNSTISYILNTDADIVNLQEAEYLHSDSHWHITQQQVDSLRKRYPYMAINAARDLSVYSKYPMELVPTHIDPSISYTMACFRLDIKGQRIHLMNVHLKSIGLTDEDKILYKEAMDMPESKSQLKKEIKEVKSKLISKLTEAFRTRAIQAKAVREVIDSIGGPFIVAGDFNDIPDCYAVRTIRSTDMNDAYSDAAFGPTITYHADRFYFRIDQVLYRGPFKAIDIEKGNISSSDHSPLLTTFLFDKP